MGACRLRDVKVGRKVRLSAQDRRLRLVATIQLLQARNVAVEPILIILVGQGTGQVVTAATVTSALHPILPLAP
jgi:hypothetical protein